MTFVESILVALGLAMDAFAVSLGVGTSGRAADFRSRFRLAFHSGLFQSLMTLAGWLVGATIAGLISAVDHWIAFALLAYVGINMIRDGLSKDGKTDQSPNPTRGRTLVMVCIATSLDAFAVGLSMALIKAPIILPAIMIGVVALTLSAIGIRLGALLGEQFGKKMEVLGGLILLGIGFRILVQHLWGI